MFAVIKLHGNRKQVVNIPAILLENPYWQMFCGLEGFATKSTIESSTLSRLRKRLGASYVKEMEDATYGVLIEKVDQEASRAGVPRTSLLKLWIAKCVDGLAHNPSANSPHQTA